MPIPRFPNSPLSRFFQERTKFENAAKARNVDWLNHGEGDTPFETRVVVEMLMASWERLDALEAILKPE